MSRPTRITISPTALLHNVKTIQAQVKTASIMAMIKANAYGCGVNNIAPFLHGVVSRFGVASQEEALAIRALGIPTPCTIIQGAFEPTDWLLAAEYDFEYVIHYTQQLEWLLKTPLKQPITTWVKINTGMNRLGILPKDLPQVMNRLQTCAWVKQPIPLMMHFANADIADHPLNHTQYHTFQKLTQAYPKSPQSLANSAAIFNHPETHADVIRPGISLYGVSPFSHGIGQDLGLVPVMTFTSQIINTYPIAKGEAVGYGSTWVAQKPSRIGVIPVGYGDGYPRQVKAAYVFAKGMQVPIIGIISMDTITLDLTDFPELQSGDSVELWGKHMPVETIAKAANTIPYELLCHITNRPCHST